jgi:hypothetical protein
MCQADTTSTGTWKATETTSSSTSNESVQVTSQILQVVVLVSSHQKEVYESLSVRDMEMMTK